MNNNRKILKTECIPFTPFTKTIYGVYDDGACQCHKNCNCSSRRGTFLFSDEKFTHPLSTKVFSSLRSCEQSFNSLSKIS